MSRLEENFSERERRLRNERLALIAAREEYEDRRDRQERLEYAHVKAMDQLTYDRSANPVNGQFFHAALAFHGPGTGSHPSSNGGLQTSHLPRPAKSAAVSCIEDIVGAKGVKQAPTPLPDYEASMLFKKRRSSAVTEIFKPFTPPEQMIPDSDSAMFESGSPTPRNIRVEDGGAESTVDKSFKHTKSSAAPPPLIISKTNANVSAQAAQGPPPTFKKLAGTINNQQSAFPTESLLALLDKQEAVKAENASVSSVHTGSAPASRGSKHLSPDTLSFDTTSSSLAGSIHVGETAQFHHIKTLQSEIELTRKAVMEKQQELDQVRLANHILDNIISESSTGENPNTRSIAASRNGKWDPATGISPVEYRPSSGHSESFLASNNRTQSMWSSGVAPYGASSMNFTAMNASMGNLSFGSEWAPTTSGTGVPGMMKAPLVNQHMPLGTQAELGSYPRPYFERSSFLPSAADAPAFPSAATATSNFGAGVSGAPSHSVLNDPSVMFVGDEYYRRNFGNGNLLGNSSRPVSSNSNRGGRASYSQYQSGTINTYNPRSGWVATPAYPPQPFLSQAPTAAFGSRPSPGPVGSRLSPTATEFPYSGYTGIQGPWNPQPAHLAYADPPEHLNYRRLLERNAICDWNQIVDRIIAHNDQQASIFLQQKLKLGTNEQRYEIVEAIIAQAYMLMINRFGNFLIQRCFEHGSHEQVIKIAQAIQGHTLELSMDSFGCHVVQKAFDAVPENYKAVMVHELLRRIPETVVHRYACHVWQKLFELRWNDSPPQIMRFVNDALRGMWHEVALGETGSLVVQNIFENCLDEDKRPCIDEILLSIDVVAHGQFGNWCIQHICEHGAPKDKKRAIDHILRFASQYSMDQYASKVIEKCLKIGGAEFLQRYLDRVCDLGSEASRGPRIPLIDIASDQFGNYLIQWILINSNAEPLKEIVASHVRKHMVSLRGSKYGSRVAMLCCNPDIVCRPGAPHLLPAPPANRGGTIGSGYGHGHGHGGYQVNHNQHINNGFRNNGNFVSAYR